MGSKVVKYSFVAIGIYLVVYYGSNSGRLLSKGAKGTEGIIRAFQGR